MTKFWALSFPMPAMVLAYWVLLWLIPSLSIWPIYALIVAVWMSFAVMLISFGALRLAGEPLSNVTVHVSRSRAVLTKEQLLVSLVSMTMVFHALFHAGYGFTLFIYLIVCAVNLVTRALAWYTKHNEYL